MSRYLALMYVGFLLWLVADLTAELIAGDWWRAFAFGCALACLLGLRRELTTEPQ